MVTSSSRSTSGKLHRSGLSRPRAEDDLDTDARTLLVEGKVLGSRRHGVIGGIGSRDGKVDESMKYVQGRPGGFDPHARIPDMDLDGIDAASSTRASACSAERCRTPGWPPRCAAYNRWLADYCKPYPDRLFRRRDAADAVDPDGDRGDALRAQRARLRGASCAPIRTTTACSITRTTPVLRASRSSTSPLAARGRQRRHAAGGVDRFKNRGARHIISHTMEMMLAAMSVIWRACATAIRRCASLPRVGRRMDRAVARPDGPPLDDQGFNDSGLSMRPSELFQRKLLDLVRAGRGQPLVLADYIGPHKILGPPTTAPDGFFPARRS